VRRPPGSSTLLANLTDCIFEDEAHLREARREARTAVVDELGALLPDGLATPVGEVIAKKGI
jgi:hypothetical protein